MVLNIKTFFVANTRIHPFKQNGTIVVNCKYIIVVNCKYIIIINFFAKQTLKVTGVKTRKLGRALIRVVFKYTDALRRL